MSQRIQPTAEWITTEDVAVILCVTVFTVDRLPLDSIRRRSRSRTGSGPGVGFLWNRLDVEYVAELKHGARISLSAAIRVFMSVRDQRVSLSDRSIQAQPEVAGV